MAPGTGTDAPPVAQRLLTHTWPKTSPAQYIQANKSKHSETVQQYTRTANQTRLELFYALQRSRGHKEHLKRS